jgi:hypothetical protein
MDESSPTPAPTAMPIGTGRETPPPVQTTFETCANTASYRDAEGAVPCFSQAACDGYSASFGEPCCLAGRCICGSTADAGGCAVFSSSGGGVTVPTTP